VALQRKMLLLSLAGLAAQHQIDLRRLSGAPKPLLKAQWRWQAAENLKFYSLRGLRSKR
jgi:hypothetical protein